MSHPSNLIFLYEDNYGRIEQALLEWINEYGEQLNSSLVFYTHQATEDVFIIETPASLSQDLFFFLVNFLTIPYDLPANTNIRGYYVLKEGLDLLKKGEEVIISAPIIEEDFDAIYCLTKLNNSYKIDFGWKVSVIENNLTYTEPEYSIEQSEFIEGFVPQDIEKRKAPPESNSSFYNYLGESLMRIKLLYALAALIIIGSNLLINDTETLAKWNYIIVIGMLVWLFIDYDLYKIARNYILLLGLSSMLILYGLMVDYYLPVTPFENEVTWYKLYSSPLIFLVIHFPVRQAFVKLVKRDPIFDRYECETEDWIYKFLLIGLTAIVTISLFDL